MRDPLLEHVEEIMRRRGTRGETRLMDFIARNQMPVTEIVMVQLASGECYPQWRGASAEILKREGFTCCSSG